jgi:hypothetical protein
MKTLVRAAAVALVSIGLSCTAASAVEIFEDTPCETLGFSPCETITRDTNFPRNLRDTSFAVANFGRAQVTVQGSMVCSSENKDPAVVDLVTQIVTSQNAVPAIDGPGGARHAAVILPTEQGTSVSFNLASTRALFIPPGQSVISFNVTSLRMDPSTTCFFHNLNFTTIYVER